MLDNESKIAEEVETKQFETNCVHVEQLYK